MQSKSLVASLAAVAAFALVASPAAAKPRKAVEPLGQYVVSGKVDTDELARAGFDLREASGTGRRGRFFIVATRTKAAAIARKGATVRAVPGRRHARARAAAVTTAAALPAPEHGYDVFRPWSLKPAPCPTTCATPLKPLKAIYSDLARANPDVVKQEVIGRTGRGQAILAYKVTADARSTPDGARPAVLYDATQHAREWIAAETERRLFEYVLANKDQREGPGIRRLLRQRELWFVPIANPDGYDYTFTEPGNRLWRKNLRDNDSDGQITEQDGVDTNRNFPTKWNYDLEGASNDRTNETYHGPSAGSEPEVQALRRLERRVRPRFQIDYHSYAQLILYPEGWQVQTEATDAPLLAALAGTDDNPAVPGFDPDVSSELYTTNGDVTDDSLGAYGIQAYTVELDGGSGHAAGGTDETDPAYTPGGFVFQDRDADIAAEAQKNFAFALDLARSAGRPDRPVSHLGNTAPDLVPSTFSLSYGTPQTVEVNAKRSLGAVRAHWQVNAGRVRSAPTTEFDGGSRYGGPGVYYHRLRAQTTGVNPGDTVRVWFTAKGRQSASFTYRLVQATENPVLLVVAEDYKGRSASEAAGPTPYPGPLYQDTYAKALRDAGIGYDVYDIDARGRTAPTSLGVLGHYKAVVWETGEDFYVRGPDQVAPGGPESGGGTGTEKLFDDEVLGMRDYMNESGKLLVAGKTAFQGSWDEFLFNPLGATPPQPFCKSNTSQGQSITDDDPPGQLENCVKVSNDFQQYWLGAYLPITAAADADTAAALPFQETSLLGSLEFTVNGEDSAKNQDNVNSFLTTSSILKPDVYPQFKSEQAITFDRPPAFDPPTGSWYVFSGSTSSAYKRLARTVYVPPEGGSLEFTTSYDLEPGYDFLAVEAHTVGQDDWTTLPDVNGNTTQDPGLGCLDKDPFWLNENPFLRHYITRSETTSPFECAPHGTSGAWNAATGNSGGFQAWKVDLGAYAGKQVEVSITTVTDPGVNGLGVFVDDAKVTAGAASSQTSFESDLGGWTVAVPPADSGANVDEWRRTQSVGYADGPGVATDHSLFLGFGPEGVTGAADRSRLLGDGLRYLGVQGG